MLPPICVDACASQSSRKGRFRRTLPPDEGCATGATAPVKTRQTGAGPRPSDAPRPEALPDTKLQLPEREPLIVKGTYAVAVDDPIHRAVATLIGFVIGIMLAVMCGRVSR